MNARHDLVTYNDSSECAHAHALLLPVTPSILNSRLFTLIGALMEVIDG
jgi:hypothetical protein